VGIRADLSRYLAAVRRHDPRSLKEQWAEYEERLAAWEASRGPTAEERHDAELDAVQAALARQAESGMRAWERFEADHGGPPDDQDWISPRDQVLALLPDFEAFQELLKIEKEALEAKLRKQGWSGPPAAKHRRLVRRIEELEAIHDQLWRIAHPPEAGFRYREEPALPTCRGCGVQIASRRAAFELHGRCRRCDAIATGKLKPNPAPQVSGEDTELRRVVERIMRRAGVEYRPPSGDGEQVHPPVFGSPFGTYRD
jgi:hypothetical protein